MSNSNSRQLYYLFQAQDGLCFYCGRRAYLPHSLEMVETMRALCIRHGSRQWRQATATREHLHRLADGGADRLENMVMACGGCNSDRGDRAALLHLAHKRTMFVEDAMA